MHNLNLAPRPFEAIKSGNKTIESRLYDERRQIIELGDTIIFTNREQSEQTVAVKVIGLLRYDSFKNLFTHNDPVKFGGTSPEQLLARIREFYTVEQEQEYGVVGIELVLISP